MHLLKIPGDKSISHRAIVCGALAQGITQVSNIIKSRDVLVTIETFRALGVSIEEKSETELTIKGVGLHGLKQPKQPLAMGESGTTMRLMIGLLGAQPFETTLIADEALAKRPMMHVVKPIRTMGALITGEQGGEYPPLVIQGGNIQSIHYESPIASAQIKSAILLAGLYAEGETSVSEPYLSRDHTERMLRQFGADVVSEAKTARVQGLPQLIEQKVTVPGDFSSAAFFIVGATLVPSSVIQLQGVSLNPTRTGLLTVLKEMGANFVIEEKGSEKGEPQGDILIKSASLKGVTVSADQLPSMIDEVPILMIAAALAEGKTIIQGAGELRVKETDRIASMKEGITAIGGDIQIQGDDILIQGVLRLKGGSVKSYGDHRTAMALTIAGLTTEEEVIVDNLECISKSYPSFLEQLRQLGFKPVD